MNHKGGNAQLVGAAVGAAVGAEVFEYARREFLNYTRSYGKTTDAV
jgi:hypothetical protein